MSDTTRTIIIKAKSIATAYLLFFFFGFALQIHRFYAGNKLVALVLLLCPILGFFFPFFWFIWAILAVADIVYIPFMVNSYNRQQENSVDFK